MSALPVRVVPQDAGWHLVDCCQGAEDLASLLRASAVGNEDAFGRFYDATCRDVLALELARAGAGGLPAAEARRAAEQRLQRRFVTAWRLAARQPASGLSPLTWLLSLTVALEEASCG